MKSSASNSKLISLPSDENNAKQIFYGLMTAGIFFLPMTLAVFHNLVAPNIDLITREFFILFSTVYILIFIFCSAIAQKTSFKLRERLGKSLPRDAIVLAITAAKSNNIELISLAKKYWCWQLVLTYLSGIAFSWLACIFVLFIL